MTRGFQLLLRRIIRVLAFCMFMAALTIGSQVLLSPPQPEAIELSLRSKNDVSSEEKIKETDPKIARLLNTKMSKTIVQKVEVVQKPPVPNLSTLIRVKGIMDFGDPKTNEAIVETIKSNQTKNYRVGESVQDVHAVVTSIDSAVTFTYDGKSIRMNVNAAESAEVFPTAGGGSSALTSTQNTVKQTP